MVVHRSNDVAIVPAVVGSTVHDAIEYADWAGVGIGRDTDGPPLSELVYPGEEFVVTSQTPPPGTLLRRFDTVIVEWSRVGGDGAGAREPRRPLPPTARFAIARELPDA